ncbi:MAG: tRNA lysidine(34) synthetase TilS [Schleiferiaceae bacterium]|nr:tRNA lysidine(34) synthetase TilS [Schleiferiaceae bacterium]
MQALTGKVLDTLLRSQRITRVLLGVSGGVDSMVLLHLFQQTTIYFEVAHVNYNLREGAGADEALVKTYCEKNGIVCHTLVIPKSDWDDHTGSIQLKAREQRYAFFNTLQKEHSLPILATAHHRDDAQETFFINLLRGTGLKGLAKWSILKNNRFRPLLYFSKKTLYTFAKQNNIPWQEDTSNAKNTYLRNHIRLKILPLLFEKDTRQKSGFARTLELLESERDLLNEAEREWVACHVTGAAAKGFVIQTETSLDMKWLSRWISNEPFRIIAPWEVLAKAKTGSLFRNKNWELRRERGFFQLGQKTTEEVWHPQHITKETKSLTTPFFISFETLAQSEWDGPQKGAIDLDKDKLCFPLILRNREPGDTIQPLGMKGKRKVKKVFTDRKLSHLEKEKTLVLCDSKNAVALLWLFPAETYKVTPKTTTVYRIKTHF